MPDSAADESTSRLGEAPLRLSVGVLSGSASPVLTEAVFVTLGGPVDDPLLDSLEAAGDLALRLHLAGLLLDQDRVERAVMHVAHVLSRDPSSDDARRLMARAM